MKEYRLSAWPQLSAPFDRTAHRRMLSDMSQRHVTLAQLADSSHIRRHEVQQFIDMLDSHGLIDEREATSTDSVFASLKPLGGWFKRTLDHRDR